MRAANESPPEVVVSLAGSEERQACYRLAYEIFCEEMGAMRKTADHERRLVSDEMIERAEVFCAKVDDEVVGSIGVLLGGEKPFPDELERGFDIPRFVPLLPRREMALAIRFLVRPQHRGTQVPIALMAAVGRLLAEHRIKLTFCDCQPHLIPLYTGMRFRPHAPLFEQAGFGLMVPLVLITRFAEPDLTAAIEALLPHEPPVQSVDALSEEAWAKVFEVLHHPRPRVSAFEDFTEDELQELLDHSQLLHCRGGQQVIVEGQGARTAYLVLEGTVEVRRHGQTLATFSTGEMFGEFALLLDSKRTADAFAVGDDVRLVALNEKALKRLIASRSPVAAKLLWNIARALALKLAHRER